MNSASHSDLPRGEAGRPVGGHQLNSRFHFSFMKRSATSRNETYGSSIKEIGSFGSIEDFWSFYSHLTRPNDLAVNTDYYMFREPVKPLWEDPENKNGGRWTIRMKKGIANRAFEDMSICLIGEQFDEYETVNGLALSVRYQEDVLSLWTRTSDEQSRLDSIRDVAQAAMEYLPAMKNTDWEYKRHEVVVEAVFKNDATVR
mmetsp:Transcript_27463/g.107470  ORF Transcript_27463/g.107470 Transcript_27463/m.107470 type:complete len:201 (-) Transcript_27463:515-1117(-)